MQFTSSVLLFIVLFSDCILRSASDNCGNIKYTTIQDARRSTAFNSTVLKKRLCDVAVIKDDAWYRFQSEAGGEMPTTVPDYYTCGTYVPIWLNGIHPTVEEGKVKRQACVKLPHRRPIDCGESYDIHVVNCSGYYIYQLKTPNHCNLAYCAGSKVPNCTTDDPTSVCPANVPPYFNMPSKFYAIKNTELQIQIIAVDPEYQSLKYSVLSNGTMKAAIDIDERLTVTVEKSGSVYVKIEDDIGQESILAIQITVVQCPCKNGTRCVWGNISRPYPVKSPNYTCNAPPHFNMPSTFFAGKNTQLKIKINAVDPEAQALKYSLLANGTMKKASISQDGRLTVMVEKSGSVYVEIEDDIGQESILAIQITVVQCPCKNGTRCVWGNISRPYPVKSPNYTCNAPPHFNMPSTFFAGKNTQLKIKINAVDPEAQALKYSLLANGTMKKASISQDGRLTVMVEKSGSVYVEIEDDIGQESTLAIQITVVQCLCQNGGKCIWDNSSPYPVKSPNYTCTCVESYTGRTCGVFNSKTKACENVPCFPGLNCSVTSDSFSCETCPKMFEGDGKDCTLKVYETISIKTEIIITAGLIWTDQLTNKSSLDYKKATAQITTEIRKIYVNVAEFVYVIITGYQKGSVIVKFNIIMTKETDQPLEPLQRSIKKNGKLGTLKVDPVKLKENPGRKKIFGLNKTVFTIVMVIVSLLSLTAIIAVAMCIRQKKITIMVLTVNEDRAEICPNVDNRSTKVRRPSHNQVVDISSVKNPAFLDDQCI